MGGTIALGSRAVPDVAGMLHQSIGADAAPRPVTAADPADHRCCRSRGHRKAGRRRAYNRLPTRAMYAVQGLADRPGHLAKGHRASSADALARVDHCRTGEFPDLLARVSSVDLTEIVLGRGTTSPPWTTTPVDLPRPWSSSRGHCEPAVTVNPGRTGAHTRRTPRRRIPRRLARRRERSGVVKPRTRYRRRLRRHRLRDHQDGLDAADRGGPTAETQRHPSAGHPLRTPANGPGGATAPAERAAEVAAFEAHRPRCRPKGTPTRRGHHRAAAAASPEGGRSALLMLLGGIILLARPGLLSVGSTSPSSSRSAHFERVTVLLTGIWRAHQRGGRRLGRRSSGVVGLARGNVTRPPPPTGNGRPVLSSCTYRRTWAAASSAAPMMPARSPNRAAPPRRQAVPGPGDQAGEFRHAKSRNMPQRWPPPPTTMTSGSRTS
jgi:hypothetical protein